MKHLKTILMKIISFCLSLIPHFTLLYFLLFLLLNSSLAFPIFNLFVNELFSGGIYWSKLEFGPYPWQVKIENILLKEGNGKVVAKAKALDVKEFYYTSLFEDGVMANDLSLYELEIDLQERESLLFGEDLWNIAELFFPLEGRVEDGEPPSPMNLDFRNINLYNAKVSLKMPVIELKAQNINLTNAYFHFLVESKQMYMGAQKASFEKGESQIFIREEAISPAPLPKIIEYQVSQLEIDDFFWRARDFGARRLSAQLFGQDQISTQNLLMHLIPGAIPALQMDFQADIKNIGLYVKAWSLDQQMVGKLQAKGHLYGPISQSAGIFEAQGSFEKLFTVPIEHFDIKFNKSLDHWVHFEHFIVKHPHAEASLQGSYQLSKAQGSLSIQIHQLKWYDFVKIPSSQLQTYRNWLKPIDGELLVQAYKPIGQINQLPQLIIQSKLKSPTLKPLVFDSLISLHPLTGIKLIKTELMLGQAKTNQAPMVTLKTEGNIAFLPHLSLDLKHDLTLHFSEAKLDMIDIPIKGKLSLQAKLKGKVDQLAYDIKLQAQELMGRQIPLAIQRLHANIDGDMKKLNINALEAELLGGQLKGKLAIDLKQIKNIKGWYTLEGLSLNDQSLAQIAQSELFEFSTQIQSFGCHTKQGCGELIKERPELLEQYQIINLKPLFENTMLSKDGFQVALELQNPKIRDLQFDELSMFLIWEDLHLNINQISLSRKQKRFVTGSADINFKANELNELSLKINRFPLNLIQLFVPQPHLSLKTMSGTMKAEINAKGKFDNLTAEGLFHFKKLSMQIPKGNDSFLLSMGKSDLKLELKNQRLNLIGKLSKAFDIEAFVPLKKKDKIELAELKLNIKNLSTSYLRAIPEDEESYIDEYKVLSKLVQDDVDFAPIPLLDATEGLSFLGLGNTFYCASQALPLVHGQLAHLFLNGVIRLKFDPFQRLKPIISTSFDQFQFDYWMRGDEGELIQLPNSPPCASLCPNQDYICPTISLKSRENIDFELLQHQNELLAYLNPVQNQDSALENEESLQRSHVETCHLFENQGMLASFHRNQASLIKVKPMTLEGSNQKIVLGGFAEGDALKGCSNASFDLGILFPFLSNVYQQIEGQAQLFTALYGQLSNPQIEGFFKLKDLSLLSPRSQVVGELRLIDPLTIQINPLKNGGFTTALPSKQEVSFQWDDGEIKMKSFQLKLPLFKFESFALDFSANQLELKLPNMVKLSAQLQDMRFEFDRKSDRLEDQRMLLSGDIELLRGVYSADIQGSSEINEGFRNNIAGKSKVQSLSIYDKSPILKRLFLNLRVRGENDFFVRNQVAVVKLNLEISMDLRIKGFLYSLESTPLSEQLRLSGEVKTLTGSKITYANRRFDVVDGILRFGDGLNTGQTGSFLNANLEATHTFRIPKSAVRGRQVAVDQSSTSEMIEEEVTLKTKIELPSQNAKPIIDFNLTSPSGASKLELATLVLTGKFPSKVNTATSAQPATEVLLSPLLNLIERPIEDTLDLDLNLTPDTTGLLFVDLNKIFSRRLRLYARTPIGDDLKNNSQLFSLEYRFNNLIYGEISNDRVNQVSSTNGRFRLRLSWD